MISNTDFATMLEQALGVLQNRGASAADCGAAAEQARRAVHGIDTENESAPQRESQILAAMVPAGGKSIVETLEALDKVGEQRALMRKIATALAAALDVRSRDAAKAESARDEARKPFAAETKRAHEFAKRFAEYPTLASRIVSLFQSDVLVARFGSNAYSRVPVRGSHVSFERTIRLPRMLATPERRTAMRLLGFWPPKWNNFEGLEAPYYHDDEPDRIAGPVHELCQKSIISDGDVDRVVARAQTALVSEYHRTCAAVRELLALDDQITAADRGAKYPDGALIFDPAMFPAHWQIGVMNKTINGYPRVALPVIDGMAMAAE
jgi:hypothetical protein